MLQKIEADFKEMTNNVQKAFIDGSIVLDDLLINLKNSFATKNKKIPLFKENFFRDITSIEGLFEALDFLWNLYDHDTLAFLINIADCKKASKIYTEFISSVDLSAFDLVNHCSDKEIPILPGYEKLQIKVEKSKCTIKMIERIKMMVVEYYDLENVQLYLKKLPKGVLI